MYSKIIFHKIANIVVLNKCVVVEMGVFFKVFKGYPNSKKIRKKALLMIKQRQSDMHHSYPNEHGVIYGLEYFNDSHYN